MLASVLAAALTVLTDESTASSAAPQPPLVIRIHSLAGIVEDKGTTEGALSLLPYRTCNSQSFPEVSDEPGPCALHSEDVCALVREMVEPSFWEETPRSAVDLRGPDRLLVIASAEVQDEVADFLAHLQEAVASDDLLEVRVLDAEAGDVDATELAIDPAEADRRGTTRGVHRRARAALRGISVSAAKDIEGRSIVYDYDVEIAQGATISDPIVEGIEVGLELIARATRVDGGTLVNLVARESEEAAPDVARRLEAHSLVNAKPVMSERSAVGLLQHPRLRFASFAGTVLVPDGKAVWIPVTVKTHLGLSSFCLDLRVAGRGGAARKSLEPAGQPGGEPMRLDFWSLGSFDLGDVGLEGPNRNLFDFEWTNDGTAPIWASLHSPTESDLMINLVNTIADEALENGHGSVGYSGSFLRTWLPRPFAEKVTAALAPLQRVEANVVVRGQIREGANERASFRLPVVIGHPLALWSGVQGTQIVDWDVEVANEAQACNPTPEAWVDGFALRLEVSRNARGELVLDVRSKINLLQGPPTLVDLNDDSHLALDEVTARKLHVNELRVLPAQGGKASFGGDLALELEVTTIAAR